MDIIQALSLALLQGLTEFLPISSTAHLILLPVLLGWEDQGLAFDVAVHIGTLLAVLIYYRTTLAKITVHWLASCTGKAPTADAKLGWRIILATVPVGLVGVALPEAWQLWLRSPLIIATSSIVFALLLLLAQQKSKQNRSKVTTTDAIIIGLFQAVALIPGTSRAGITLSAGLLLGLDRQSAARFCFLLAIPVIALAGMLKSFEIYQASIAVDWGLLGIGVAVSLVVAYLSIGWFLRLLDAVGVLPFVYYRLALGLMIFVLFW